MALNARIQQKHDIEFNWNKASGFIPNAGEIIIYDPDAHLEGEGKGTRTVAQFKIGNGFDNVIDLPFSEQVDWNQEDEKGFGYIKNKPPIKGDDNLANIEVRENILLKAENPYGASGLNARVTEGGGNFLSIHVNEINNKSYIDLTDDDITLRTFVNNDGGDEGKAVFTKGTVSFYAEGLTEDNLNGGFEKYGSSLDLTKNNAVLEYSHPNVADGVSSGLTLDTTDATMDIENGYGEAHINAHIDNGGSSYVELHADMLKAGTGSSTGHFGNDGTRLRYEETSNISSIDIEEYGINLEYTHRDGSTSINMDKDSVDIETSKAINLITDCTGYGTASITTTVDDAMGNSTINLIAEDNNAERHYGNVKVSSSDITIEHNSVGSYPSKITLNHGIVNIQGEAEAGASSMSIGNGYVESRGEVISLEGGDIFPGSIRISENNITLDAATGTISINGTLDADIPADRITGTISQANLPSYVDDVLEYTNLSAFPATGEVGKIYIALDTNKTYRWSGTTYAPIGSDLALGETSSTAYRGDYGKIAYNHATAKGNAYSAGFYKVGTNAEGHVTNATAVSASDITGLIGQPDWDQADITAANYIKNKIPFEKGESENSIQQIGNTAISSGTVSMGADSVAGSKCYYISGVDTANKQIYLSKTQTDLRAAKYKLTDGHFAGSNYLDISGTFKSNGQTFSRLTYDPSTDPPNIGYDNLRVCSGANGFENDAYETVEIDRANTSNELISFLETYCEPISPNGNLTIDSDIANNGIPEEVRNEVVGKYISIRNARHYEFLAKVVSLTEDGILTYDGTLGFTDFICLETDGIPKPDEWTVRIPEVTDFGEVILAKVEGHDAAATNGSDCHAAGIDSFSVNTSNVSGGYYSFTSGRDNMTGYGAFSTGRNNKSMCLYSFTNGIGNIAGYNPDHTADEVFANLTTDYLYYAYNHAEGQNTRAVRRAAHSQGYKTTASGLASFSGGANTEASGDYATSLGYNTKSIGLAALSLGTDTEATGDHAIAGGAGTKAKGTNAVVFGNGCGAEGYNALVSGLSVNVNAHHSFGVGRANTIYADANYGAVVGYNNNIYGSLSFAAGEKNTIKAKRSFAIGYNNQVLNETADGQSHGTCFVAGQNNTADGGYNATFGGSCQNYGLYSITNGLKCIDYASHSIVSGRLSVINKDCHYSFNSGYGNITNNSSTIVAGRGLSSGRAGQAVFGEYNAVDKDAMLVVGNGNGSIASDGTVSGTLSNALVVKKNGDIVASGNIILGNTTLTEAKLKKLLDFIDTIEG